MCRTRSSRRGPNYYHHNGVDLKGTIRALSATRARQQAGCLHPHHAYVRMALEYSATVPRDVVAASQDTPERKINEMKYALESRRS